MPEQCTSNSLCSRSTIGKSAYSSFKGEAQSIPAIEQFLPLIHKFSHWCEAKLRDPKQYDYEDLISEGFLVYTRVRNTFDPSRGIQFITPFYASLRNRYSYLIKQHNKHIRIPIKHFKDAEHTEDQKLEEVADERKPEERLWHLLSNIFYRKPSRQVFIVIKLFLESENLFYENDERRLKRICRRLSLNQQEIKEEIAAKLKGIQDEIDTHSSNIPMR